MKVLLDAVNTDYTLQFVLGKNDDETVINICQLGTGYQVNAHIYRYISSIQVEYISENTTTIPNVNEYINELLKMDTLKEITVDIDENKLGRPYTREDLQNYNVYTVKFSK